MYDKSMISFYCVSGRRIMENRTARADLRGKFLDDTTDVESTKDENTSN